MNGRQFIARVRRWARVRDLEVGGEVRETPGLGEPKRCLTHNYPAEIGRDEDGRYVVAFPDFGWGATDGATRDEALAEARDLLRELIAVTMREGKDLPEPSRALGQPALVVPPVPIALKAALYEAFREAGMSQRGLARDLGVAESEVRRMLSPDHATKAATIDRALRRLGKRVTVTVGEAA